MVGASRTRPRALTSLHDDGGYEIQIEAVGWWSATKDWYRQRMVIPASLGIAGIALYWTFERLASG